MILFTDHSPGLGITQVQASAGLAELGQPRVPTLDSPETLEDWQALSRGLGGNQGRKPSLGGKALRTYLQWFRLFCAKSMRPDESPFARPEAAAARSGSRARACE